MGIRLGTLRVSTLKLVSPLDRMAVVPAECMTWVLKCESVVSMPWLFRVESSDIFLMATGLALTVLVYS